MEAQKRFALISVSDKRNISGFAKSLRELNFEIAASIKTSKHLKKSGIKVTDVEDITGYPPIAGKQGIKLIHPKIFGGILADPRKKKHRDELKKYKINPFSIVVCNFYPFEKVVSKNKFSHSKALENIDVGGPAMVRCAAKNYSNVAVITDISDYPRILKELKQNGKVSRKTGESLAAKAFKYMLKYDKLISKYLSSKLG
ncbi:MAG TPA: hypothetical protein VI933_00685 [archaeon]|nr:hypothetical protein [archaeon]